MTRCARPPPLLANSFQVQVGGGGNGLLWYLGRAIADVDWAVTDASPVGHNLTPAVPALCAPQPVPRACSHSTGGVPAQRRVLPRLSAGWGPPQVGFYVLPTSRRELGTPNGEGRRQRKRLPRMRTRPRRPHSLGSL